MRRFARCSRCDKPTFSWFEGERCCQRCRISIVRSARERGLVYFIENTTTGSIKIGWSLDVEVRRKGLQAATGAPLRVLATEPGDRGREAELHRRFAGARLGGEWFRATPDLVAYVARAGAGQRELFATENVSQLGSGK